LTISDGLNTIISEPTIVTATYSITIANFTANLTSGNTPLNVQFTNLSSGIGLSYSWSFGDGTSSNLVNPLHTYQNAGFYSVTLYATGIGGYDIETKVDYISVLGNTGTIQVLLNIPNASFFVTGPSNYSGSGLSSLITNAPIGTYTIQYSTVQGYQKPSGETFVLSTGETIIFSGNYINNSNPSLSWTEEPNFENDGLNPENGTISSTYTFRIKYSDADNNAPETGYPELRIYNDGALYSTFEMSKVDQNSYVSGSVYSVDVTGLPEGDNYTYRFKAYDSNHLIAGGEGTEFLPGPVIYEIEPPSIAVFTDPLRNGLPQGTPVFVPGVENRGMAASFDGEWRIVVDNSAPVDFLLSGDWTMSFSVYPADNVLWGNGFMQRAEGEGSCNRRGIILFLDGNDGIGNKNLYTYDESYLDGNGNFNLANIESLQFGQWNRLTIVHRSDQIGDIYVNGVKTHSNIELRIADAGTKQMSLGCLE
jgi:PKD repeat protein